jgi:uncharacterized membrane-anchored protein YhcB (DUF1043 family)
MSSGTINMNLSPENNKMSHDKYQEEIDRLKNELEKYRNKTVATFKAKAFKVYKRDIFFIEIYLFAIVCVLHMLIG